MTDLCEQQYFCYRGLLHTNDLFHIVATGVSPTNKDNFYVVCNNTYTENNEKFHRLYLSRDPYDFIPCYTGDTKNDGATFFRYNINNDNYELSYVSKNHEHINDKEVNVKSQLYNIDSPDLSKLDIDVQMEKIPISIIPEKNLSGKALYAGTEYKISTAFNNTNNELEWLYKKDSTTTPVCNPRELLNQEVYSDSAGFFIKSQSSTNAYSLSQIYNDSGSSIITGIWDGVSPVIDNLPKSGIIGFKQSTDKYFYKYNLQIFDNDTNNGISIHYSSNLGTLNLPGTSSGFSIYFYNENISSNYEKVTNTGDLKFYIIPQSTKSYFSDGSTLFYLPKHGGFSHSFKYSNPFKNGIVLNNKAIPFLVSKQINDLPSLFTTNLFDNNKSFMGNKTTYNGSHVANLPYLIWTTSLESKINFFYPYCSSNDICGNCMGTPGEYNKDILCHADSFTTEYLTSNDKIPLTAELRDVPEDNFYEHYKNKNTNKVESSVTNTESDGFYILIGACVAVVVIIIIIISVSGKNKNKQTKTEILRNFDFDYKRKQQKAAAPGAATTAGAASTVAAPGAEQKAAATTAGAASTVAAPGTQQKAAATTAGAASTVAATTVAAPGAEPTPPPTAGTTPPKKLEINGTIQLTSNPP